MTTQSPPRAAERPHGPSGVPVLRATLRRERRGVAVWCVALAAVAAMYTSFWPTMRDDPALGSLKADALGSFGEVLGMRQLGSPVGYLDATVFGLIGPILLLVFATMHGSRAVAGDDEDGVLDLYLTQPVSRRRYLLERAGALALQTACLAAAAGAVVLLLDGPVDLGVPARDVVVAVVGLWLLGATFAALALLAGAARGRRALAVAVTSGVALATYVVHALSQMVDALAPARLLSPFWWYLGHEPLSGDVLGWPLVALAVTPVVLVLAAVPLLDRRDVGV